MRHAARVSGIARIARAVVSRAGHPWYDAGASWSPGAHSWNVRPAEVERIRLLQGLPGPLRSRIAIAWDAAAEYPMPFRDAIGGGARWCRDAGLPVERMLALLTILMPELDREDYPGADRTGLRQQYLALALQHYRRSD